jgi:hypothetical protein
MTSFRLGQRVGHQIIVNKDMEGQRGHMRSIFLNRALLLRRKRYGMPQARQNPGIERFMVAKPLESCPESSEGRDRQLDTWVYQLQVNQASKFGYKVIQHLGCILRSVSHIAEVLDFHSFKVLYITCDLFNKEDHILSSEFEMANSTPVPATVENEESCSRYETSETRLIDKLSKRRKFVTW